VSGGLAALLGDPACLLLLGALALWVAQPEPPHLALALRGGAAGLLTGALLALAGVALDLTLPLLGLALLLGALVAWARPLPALCHAALPLLAAGSAVLMLGPALTQPLGFRLAWLAGVLAALALGFVLVLGLLRALLGRERGAVKRLLLRVAGSWLATAALLAGVLEWSQRLS
jgi:hypothetical protein